MRVAPAARSVVPVITAVMLAIGGAAIAQLSAQEAAPALTLTPGKGADLTMARCALCHEITHITRARLSRGEWQDNVRNMIERGMPIAPDEIPIVVEYLATYYNRDSAAPAADPAAALRGSRAGPGAAAARGQCVPELPRRRPENCRAVVSRSRGALRGRHRRQRADCRENQGRRRG
jgi:hypothetical protein